MNHSLRFFFLKKYRSTMKYRAGKLESGGEERFKRRHNPDVSMEIGDSPTQETKSELAENSLLEVVKEINARLKANNKEQVQSFTSAGEKCLTTAAKLKAATIRRLKSGFRLKKGKGTINIWRQTPNTIAFISDSLSFRNGRISRRKFQKVYRVQNCLTMIRGCATIPIGIIEELKTQDPTLDARMCCEIAEEYLELFQRHVKKFLRSQSVIRCKSFNRMFLPTMPKMRKKVQKVFDFEMNFASFKEGNPQLFEIIGHSGIVEAIPFDGSSYNCIGSGDWLANNYMEANQGNVRGDTNLQILALKAIAEASKCTYEPNGGHIWGMIVRRDGTSSEIVRHRLSTLKRNLTQYRDWVETPLSDADMAEMKRRKRIRRAG